MDNQRIYPREPVRTKSKLKVDDQWHDCVVTNISAVGVRLYMRMSVAIGKAVRIQIDELGPYDATVVWCEGDETGLRFDHDPEEIAGLMVALAS
ncbi:MAG TPA: PilZ domain-containing protein [Gallionella sp.]